MARKFSFLLFLFFLIPLSNAQDVSSTFENLDAVYQMPSYGFEFRYPDTWTSTGVENNLGIFEGGTIAPFRISVFVQSLELAGLETPTVDAIIENLQTQAVQNLTVLGETGINARRAVYVSAILASQGNFAYENLFAAYWIQNGMVFTFVYSVPELNSQEQINFETLLDNIQPIIPDTVNFTDTPLVWEAGGISLFYPDATTIDLADGRQVDIEAPTTTESEFNLPVTNCGVSQSTADGAASSRQCLSGFVSIVHGQRSGITINSVDDIVSGLEAAAGINSSSELPYYQEESLIAGRRGTILIASDDGFSLIVSINFDEAENKPYWYMAAIPTDYIPVALYIFENIVSLEESSNSQTSSPTASPEAEPTLSLAENSASMAELLNCLPLQESLTETIDGQEVAFTILGGAELVKLSNPTLNVSGNGINVRQTPNTSAEIVGSLGAGESLQADGRLEDSSWLRVQLANGGIGWVNSSVVTLEGDAQTLAVLSADDTSSQAANSFSLNAEAANLDCAEIAEGALMIQVPEGVSVRLIINRIEFEIGSSFLLYYERTESGRVLNMSTLEGNVLAVVMDDTRFWGMLSIPEGTSAALAVNDEGIALDAPQLSQGESAVFELGGDLAEDLPLPLEVAEPLDEEAVNAYFLLEEGTYTSEITVTNYSSICDLSIFEGIEISIEISHGEGDMLNFSINGQTGLISQSAFNSYAMSDEDSLLITSPSSFRMIDKGVTVSRVVYDTNGNVVSETILCEDPNGVQVFEFNK